MTNLEIKVVNSLIDRLGGVAGELECTIASSEQIENSQNKRHVDVAFKETRDVIRWLIALVGDK